jgi:hypothetical protein
LNFPDNNRDNKTIAQHVNQYTISNKQNPSLKQANESSKGKLKRKAEQKPGGPPMLSPLRKDGFH